MSYPIFVVVASPLFSFCPARPARAHLTWCVLVHPEESGKIAEEEAKNAAAAEIAELKAKLKQKDAELAELDAQLEQGDAELAELDAQLEQGDAELAELKAKLDQQQGAKHDTLQTIGTFDRLVHKPINCN